MGELQQMSGDEARALTDEIREGLRQRTDLFRKVAEAKEREAWRALDYSGWDAYVEAEFHITPRHARNLLAQAREMLAIEESTGTRPEKPPTIREATAAQRQRSTAAPRPEEVIELDDPPTGNVSGGQAVADPDTGEVPDVGWAPRQLPLWLEDLRSPIEKAADEAGVDPELWVRQAVEAALAGKLSHVERRREKVAELTAQGLSRRAIAAEVGVAKSMVDKDVAAIEGQRPKASVRPDDDGRCSECGGLPPTHQKWCSKKATKR